MLPVIPLLFLGVSALPAQYALSAMAGYIHHTEGEVWIGDRAIAPKPQDFEHVLEGRRLRTGAGKAEILLVPGSFVRVGPGSEIEMVSSGLTSATLRLMSGAVVVDLQTLYEKDSIAILAAEHRTTFRKTGLYRIDALAGAPPTLHVLDGRAHVANEAENGLEVKAGQTLVFDAAAPVKAPAEGPDTLAQWNANRHEQLAVLAEKVRKGRWDDMDEAQRNLLRMIMTRPTGMASQGQPPPSPPPSNRGGQR